MFGIVLTEEQAQYVTGIKIGNLDNINYTVKDGNKLELPTANGSTIVLDIMDNGDTVLQTNQVALVYSTGEIVINLYGVDTYASWIQN